MDRVTSHDWKLLMLAGVLVSLLAWPGTSEAQAVTIGWPDHVASEASLGSLAMTVAGTGISADFVMARALSVLGSAGTGRTNIDGLSINGIPIVPTGSPNQTIAIPGGRVVINEQVSSAGATVVNALHVVVDGVVDVVISAAKSGIF